MGLHRAAHRLAYSLIILWLLTPGLVIITIFSMMAAYFGTEPPGSVSMFITAVIATIVVAVIGPMVAWCLTSRPHIRTIAGVELVITIGATLLYLVSYLSGS